MTLKTYGDLQRDYESYCANGKNLKNAMIMSQYDSPSPLQRKR